MFEEAVGVRRAGDPEGAGELVYRGSGTTVVHLDLSLVHIAGKDAPMEFEFQSPTCGRLNGQEFLDELVEYVNNEPRQSYLITVGTDSRQLAERSSFVSVVAIQRVGRGGRYFWRRFYRKKFSAMRRRIYLEATQSLDLARKVGGGLEESLHRFPDSFDFDFEIHVDIGTNGPTSELITEIVGMVRGHGYEVRTKPNAYCAAVVADKYA